MPDEGAVGVHEAFPLSPLLQADKKPMKTQVTHYHEFHEFCLGKIKEIIKTVNLYIFNLFRKYFIWFTKQRKIIFDTSFSEFCKTQGYSPNCRQLSESGNRNRTFKIPLCMAKTEIVSERDGVSLVQALIKEKVKCKYCQNVGV